MSQSATLDELGVSRSQSSRWQKLAAVPEDRFERTVEAAKQLDGEAGLALAPATVKPAAPKASGSRARFT